MNFEKLYDKLLVIFISILVLFVLIVFLKERMVIKVNIDEYSVIDDVYFNVGEIIIDDYISFNDVWAFEKGKQISNYNMYIILKCEETNESFRIPSKYRERLDVNEVYGDENFNYKDCGVYSRVKCSQIGYSSDKKYDIYIAIENDNEKMIINTGEKINER